MKNKKYLYAIAAIFVVAVVLMIICKTTPNEDCFKFSLLDYVCFFVALPLAYVLAPALLTYILPPLKNSKLAVVCLVLSIFGMLVYAASSVMLLTIQDNNIPSWFHGNVWCWMIVGVLLTVGINGLRGGEK